MISSGIDDLQGMAQGMNDEITKQNKMLDEVEIAVDKTNEHMEKVQKKMNEALKKTRGGDKFCMDMVLIFIIVAVGLIQSIAYLCTQKTSLINSILLHFLPQLIR